MVEDPRKLLNRSKCPNFSEKPVAIDVVTYPGASAQVLSGLSDKNVLEAAKGTGAKIP